MTTYSNVITPPDFIQDNDFENVLIIDPYDSELESLVVFLKTIKKSYNVYLFRTMAFTRKDDLAWLDVIANQCQTIIVNTAPTEHSAVKDRIITDKTAIYYGPKNFLMNQNKIERLIDWFLVDSNKEIEVV